MAMIAYVRRTVTSFLRWLRGRRPAKPADRSGSLSGRMEDQPGIEQQYADSFAACDALEQFAREHRPPEGVGGTPVLTWTLARSARTFKTIVKLCRMGYGQQASMLNRTLFEDMVYAHWAARFPVRSTRLVVWHEQFVKLRRIELYKRHGIPTDMKPPDWDDVRHRRMRALFRRQSWTGRSIPKMVEMIEDQWPEGRDRDRLNRMHDVLHQGHDMLMHHSARSMSIGVVVHDNGSTTFNIGPSTDLVALALGFAFWTYANTISLTVVGDDLAALSALVTRYDGVIPDRALEALIAQGAADDDA